MATTTSTFDGSNFLQPTGFKIIINRKRFKNIEFFAQSVNHPSVSLGVATQPYQRTNVFFPGDKLEYGELTVQAIIDENLNVYEEIYDWMKQLVETNRVTPSSRQLDSQDSYEYDMRIILLTSNNTELRTFDYKDTFPINLGDMVLASSVSSVQYITLPITFKYTTFCLSDRADD